MTKSELIEQYLFEFDQKEQEKKRIAEEEAKKPFDIVYINKFEDPISANCHLGINDLDSLYQNIFSFCKEGIDKFNSGNRIKSFFDWLIISLKWMWTGESFKSLSCGFGIPYTTLREGIVEVMDILFDWSNNLITFLDFNHWEQIQDKIPGLARDFPKCLFYFVDGTALEVEGGQDIVENSLLYSQKHKISAVTFTILVAADGRIVYVSAPFVGSTHDNTVWTESHLKETLEEKYSSIESGYNYCIGADKAYPTLNLPKQWHLYITMTGGGSKTVQMDPNRHASADISTYRSVVERAFAAMKKWRIIKNKNIVKKLFHNYDSSSPNNGKYNLDTLLKIIAALVNFKSFDLGKNRSI